MQKIRTSLVLAALAIFFGGARYSLAGTITAVGSFSGDHSEGFETFRPAQYTSLHGFGGFATLTDSPHDLDVVQGSVVSVYALSPHSGNHLGFSQMASDAGILSITFNGTVQSFGGYFGEVYGPGPSHVGTGADALISFYGSSHNLLGTEAMSTPPGSLAWNGWTSSGAGIAEVDIRGTVPSDGHYQVGLGYDDLQLGGSLASPVPEPTSLALVGFGAFVLIGNAIRCRRQQKAAV